MTDRICHCATPAPGGCYYCMTAPSHAQRSQHDLEEIASVVAWCVIVYGKEAGRKIILEALEKVSQ